VTSRLKPDLSGKATSEHSRESAAPLQIALKSHAFDGPHHFAFVVPMLVTGATFLKHTHVTRICFDLSAFGLNALKVTLARLFPRGIS
jgi:hypothetical protein